MLLTLTNCIITAYIATGNLDASSHIPAPNYTIASARRDFPVGTTTVQWHSVTYHLNDHMNKRYNGHNRFDIFMSTLKEAREFGIKTNQTVTIQLNDR